MLAQSLIRAFVSLLHPRMLLLMIWPVLVALALWLVLAVLFWSQAARWVDGALRASDLVMLMLEYWPLALFAAHLGWVVLALVFVPLVLVTTVLIIGMFAMPMMVNHVAARDYRELDRLRGGSAAGSAWNSFAALAWLVALAVVTLPLWLFPLFWLPLPLLLYGYLNQRVFRYDALCEHASAEELVRIVRSDRGGLAFIHYGLGRLREMRTAPIEGSARRL